MRIPKIVTLVALFAAGLAAPTTSVAAPKGAIVWHTGKVAALEVNADGTVRALALELAGNAGRQTLSPCSTMRMADHPELLSAFERQWMTKAKTVDSCLMIVTVFT